ncbi:MAG: hypothetical protein IJA66_06395 [Alistipes sp.]|nr:hypothetical protein [Alistipes sp.]
MGLRINATKQKTTDVISRWSRKTSWRWRESKGEPDGSFSRGCHIGVGL